MKLVEKEIDYFMIIVDFCKYYIQYKFSDVQNMAWNVFIKMLELKNKELEKDGRKS